MNLSTTRNLIVHGYRLAERRVGLALLLWVFGFVPALAAALPIFFRLDAVVSPTGYAKNLAREFDLVLWSDVAQRVGGLPEQLAENVLWLMLFTLLWNALSRAGLAWALSPPSPVHEPPSPVLLANARTTGERSGVKVGEGPTVRGFWRGILKGGLRALGVSVLVLPVAFLLTLVGGAAVMGTVALFPDEKGMYRILMLFMPLVGVVLGSYLVLVRSYGVYAAVIDRSRLRSALWTGLVWPFRHPEAVLVHLAWLLAAAVLTLLPFLLELSLTAGTTAGLVTLTLLQQAALLVRAFVTVAWTGSEVVLYEDSRNLPARYHDDEAQTNVESGLP